MLNPKIRNWQGRRVWLVGASAGIGAALAVRLDAAGAKLLLSARSLEGLENVARPLQNPHLILPCDVSDPEEIEQAWQRALAQWGGVDLVIYLAGIYTPLDASAAADRVLPLARKMITVNFNGALELFSRVVPWMAAQGKPEPDDVKGVVVVSSVAGYRGLPKALAYSASKAALIAYAESLYHDLSPRGIGVWLVNPGFVATRLTEQNDFKMPALISVDEAVDEIVAGLAGGGFEIHFPKRFSRFLKFLSVLPDRVFFSIMRRIKT